MSNFYDKPGGGNFYGSPNFFGDPPNHFYGDFYGPLDPFVRYDTFDWAQLCIPGRVNSVFTDTSATTPAGVGDTVGALVDYANAWNFVQSTAGLRPTVTTDSVGIGLRFQADSMGVTTGVSINKANGYHLVMVTKATTMANQDRLFEFRDGGGSDHPIGISNGAGSLTVFTTASGLTRLLPTTPSIVILTQAPNGAGFRSLTIAGSATSDTANGSTGTINRIHLCSNYTATNNFADDCTAYFWGVAPYGGSVTDAIGDGTLLTQLQADFPGAT